MTWPWRSWAWLAWGFALALLAEQYQRTDNWLLGTALGAYIGITAVCLAVAEEERR